MRGLETLFGGHSMTYHASHHMRGLENKNPHLIIMYHASHHMRGLEMLDVVHDAIH